MKIGDLATRTGATVETIRFYEAEGLIQAPERAANNYRTYGEEHIKRLSFILRCRSLDMAHDEIRALLKLQDEPGRTCVEVDTLLAEHGQHIDERIAELKELRKQILEIRSSCASSGCIGDCGALASLRQTTGANRTARANRGRVHR